MMSNVESYIKIIGFMLLLISSFVFAMFQGGFVSWFVFYAFCPIALYSLLLFVYPLRSFEVKRRVERRECTAGDSVEVSLILTRENRFPLLYLVVRDEIAPIGFRAAKILVFPFFKKEIECRYVLENILRGDYMFHDIQLQTGDLLGACSKKYSFNIAERLLVFPDFYELGYSERELLVGSNPRVSMRKVHEHAVISGVREYQIGDQLSRIHWKATAKSNKMMTKDFENNHSEQLYVVLDREPSNSFEEMVSFAASIIHTEVKRRRNIGYFDPVTDLTIRAQKGTRHRNSLFIQLAKEKCSESGQFEKSVSKGFTAIPKQAIILFFTSQLTIKRLEVISVGAVNQTVICFVVQDEGLTELASMVEEESIKRGIRIKVLTKEDIIGRRITFR